MAVSKKYLGNYDGVDTGGGSIATLDPLARLFLVDGTGEHFLVESDDDTPCSVPQICGFSCPRIQQTLQPGTYRLKVWDTNDETCHGGRYIITGATGTGGLTLITEDTSTPFFVP